MHPEICRQLAEQHRAELLRVAARARHGRRSWRETVPAPALSLSATEAHGLRIYVTPDESRKLARDCTRLLKKYARRMADPARRPPDAVPVEVVVLSRRLPEPAGAGRGLPGPGG